jgi:hypothetical protein
MKIKNQTVPLYLTDTVDLQSDSGIEAGRAAIDSGAQGPLSSRFLQILGGGHSIVFVAGSQFGPPDPQNPQVAFAWRRPAVSSIPALNALPLAVDDAGNWHVQGKLQLRPTVLSLPFPAFPYVPDCLQAHHPITFAAAKTWQTGVTPSPGVPQLPVAGSAFRVLGSSPIELGTDPMDLPSAPALSFRTGATTIAVAANVNSQKFGLLGPGQGIELQDSSTSTQAGSLGWLLHKNLVIVTGRLACVNGFGTTQILNDSNLTDRLEKIDGAYVASGTPPTNPTDPTTGGFLVPGTSTRAEFGALVFRKKFSGVAKTFVAAAPT